MGTNAPGVRDQLYIGIYIYISEVWGLRPTGKSFCFVRACAAVCKVRMDLKNDLHPFSLFHFGLDRDSFLFPL